MKNYMVTLERQGDEVSAIMTKTYSESFRDVERIEWQPHHVVFYFDGDDMVAIRADRIAEIVSYED
jgi:hypothetical protein